MSLATILSTIISHTHTLLQSEYFLSLALKPIISSLSAYEGLDSIGGKSLEVDLYCTVNGKDKVEILIVCVLDYNTSVVSLIKGDND